MAARSDNRDSLATPFAIDAVTQPDRIVGDAEGDAACAPGIAFPPRQHAGAPRPQTAGALHHPDIQ